MKERVPVNFGQGLGHSALHVCLTQTDQNKGNCRGCAVDVSSSIESKKKKKKKRKAKGARGCSSPFGVELAETKQVEEGKRGGKRAVDWMARGLHELPCRV